MQLFFFKEDPVFSSATWPTKIIHLFSSAIKADENSDIFFVGHLGRRKYVHIFIARIGRRKYDYFRRQPTKKLLFSLTLFRRPIFIGWPTKIAIFVGICPIFVGFWPTKISCFSIVCTC
jgi:hypothetical protein